MSATTMAVEIVSREEELDSVRAFLEQRPDRGPAALVLEGEAGVGKSTLWLAGVAMARERGLRVLTARPVDLGAGGVRCLADVGALEQLEEEGDELASVSTCSAATFVGALCCASVPAPAGR